MPRVKWMSQEKVGDAYVHFPSCISPEPVHQQTLCSFKSHFSLFYYIVFFIFMNQVSFLFLLFTPVLNVGWFCTFSKHSGSLKWWTKKCKWTWQENIFVPKALVQLHKTYTIQKWRTPSTALIWVEDPSLQTFRFVTVQFTSGIFHTPWYCCCFYNFQPQALFPVASLVT